jgi:hypothetical protein
MCCLYVAEVFVVDATEYQEIPCSDCYTPVHDVCTLKLLFLCWDVCWESVCKETL